MSGFLITHDQCLDGATAALIGLNSQLRPVFVEPDRVPLGFHDIPVDAAVYLADVSLRPRDWTESASRVSHLLDHHQSALHLRHDARATIDQSRAGSHLMYDYAVQRGWMAPSAAWSRLVLDVERHDLWKPGHEAGQNLNRLFHDLGWDWYRSRFSHGWVPYTPDEATRLAELVAEESAFVTRHLSRSLDRPVPGRDFSVAGVLLDQEGAINTLSQQLLAQGHALVLTVKPDGRLSARTDVRVDAAHLMEALYHGGGHARAAGGRLTHDAPTEATELGRMLDDIAAYLTSEHE